MKNQVGYLNVVGEFSITEWPEIESIILIAIRSGPISFGASRHSLSLILAFIATLAVPPDILDYPTSTDMVVREGSNVTLKCAARGSPTPSITWRREAGDPIAISGHREGK